MAVCSYQEIFKDIFFAKSGNKEGWRNCRVSVSEIAVIRPSESIAIRKLDSVVSQFETVLRFALLLSEMIKSVA